MKVLAQKHVEKNPKRDGKTGFKTFPKSCIKLAKTAPFYRFTKTSRWGQISRPNDLSVDRLTVICMTVGVAGRPPDRSHPGQWPIGRSVSRPRPEPESELSSRSIGARSREQALWIGWPHGRPAQWPEPCACLVYIGRLPGRPRSGPVDRSVYRQWSQGVLGFWNLVF